jgi:hypothetical protein
MGVDVADGGIGACAPGGFRSRRSFRMLIRGMGTADDLWNGVRWKWDQEISTW